MVKVSIVVPVYNVESYLRECLDSAVNQTLDNIEIICVNDGSTDGSLEILKEYENKYENLKVINQENKGLGGARNTGINNACGKYIYFLDSDDYIFLGTMKVCYEESENNRLDILTFDADCFYDNDYSGELMNEYYDRSSKLDEKVIDGREFYIKCNKLDIYKAPVWLNFYNTKFIKSNKLYFEDMIHEDEVHTLKSLLCAKRVKYIDFKFFKRRFRDNSIMTRGSTEKRIDGHIKIIKELQEVDSNSELDYELKEILNENINSFIRRAIWHSDNLLNFEKRNEIKDIVSSIKKLINIDIMINKPNLIYNNNISRSENKLINRNFTIISNNCWAGAVYNKFGLKYNTPFIGLFIFAPDYIKLLKDFNNFIYKEVKFINPSNSKYKDELINNGTFNKYPIGCIDDIELHFLHYKSEEEAYDKWNRRVARMNLDNLLIKFSDRDLCTEELIKDFEELDFKNKICFTAKKYDSDYIIQFKEFNSDKSVDNEMGCYEKYIDIIKILNM